MYGAVSATLRRLGVRHAPFSASVGVTWAYASRERSVGFPLHSPVRSHLLRESLLRPSQAPQGAQGPVDVSEQSQALLWVTSSGQSAVVGTARPTWGIPMS